MRFTAAFSLLLALISTGCSGNLQDFVQVNRPVLGPLPFTNGGNEREGVKFSGGATLAVSPQGLAMQVTVGPTRQRMQGGDLVMDVGLSKSSTTR